MWEEQKAWRGRAASAAAGGGVHTGTYGWGEREEEMRRGPCFLHVWGEAGLQEKMGSFCFSDDTEETLFRHPRGSGGQFAASVTRERDRNGRHQCMDGVWSPRTGGACLGSVHPPRTCTPGPGEGVALSTRPWPIPGAPFPVFWHFPMGHVRPSPPVTSLEGWQGATRARSVQEASLKA